MFSKNIVNFVLLALLPIYIFIHTTLLPIELSISGVKDSGFISIITLTFQVSVLLMLIVFLHQANLGSNKLSVITIFYVLLIYFLREADFHRLFTLEHVTRLKFYTMDIIPAWQKYIAASMLLLFLLCLLLLLIKHGSFALNRLKIFEPWAVALLLWFSLLIFSQICDKTDLNGIHLGNVIEECCECWASIFIYLAVIQMFVHKKCNLQD
jgi:hypothetical protein